MSPIERSGGGGGGTASPLTTKGDIWGFDTTNDRIPVGSNTQVLTANSAAALGVDYEYPPGHEFDYVENTTSSTAITATSAATAVAYITGNAVTYDGSTRVKIEFSLPLMNSVAVTTGSGLAELYDGSTDLNHLFQFSESRADGGSLSCGVPVYAAVFLTPSAGSHTYSVRLWKSVGTWNALAGVGTGSDYAQAWYRITKA